MAHLIKSEQVSQFNKGQSAKIFKQVVESGEPIVVTQSNAALVVIMSAEKYEELTGEEIYIKIKPLKRIMQNKGEIV